MSPAHIHIMVLCQDGSDPECGRITIANEERLVMVSIKIRLDDLRDAVNDLLSPERKECTFTWAGRTNGLCSPMTVDRTRGPN
jgi:hypothetical protein